MTHSNTQGGDERSARRQAIRQALEAGDQAAAAALAIQALAAGDEHPLLLNLRALDHEAHERFEAALEDLRRALALAPMDFSVMNAIGLCLARMNRMAEALAAFDQALVLEPGFVPAHFNRGWTLEPLGELAAARKAYERVLELEPDHVEALAHLATLSARRGAFADARFLAFRALGLEPGLPTAEIALAAAEFGEGSAASAEARLRTLLVRSDIGPLDRAIAEGQLADVLDARGDAPGAFATYARSNQLLNEIYAPRFAAPGTLTVSGMIVWLIAYFEQASPADWKFAGKTGRSDGGHAGAGEIGHAFIVGFPRSGTTLIEQVLAAHPDVVSLEERETLHAALSAFMRGPEGLDRLAGLEGAALDPYRDAYWDAVRGFGIDPRGKLFIDKNPFNTIRLPLIAKLFPSAPIVFAVRDPRDVVFSAFRRRFGVNAPTFEYLTLEGVARSYDLTMTLAERYLGVLDQTRTDLVYERVVEDLEGEMRRVCNALGLAWTPAMSDFTGRAKHDAVASASSGQVARPLYREGIGQWRRYVEQMAPVREILDAWVTHFGYPEA